MSEEGMTDLQFKSYLTLIVSNLERVKKLGVSNEAEEELDSMIQRFEVTINS